MIPIILAILMYGMTSALLGTLLPELSQRLAFSGAQNGSAAFLQALGLIVASLFTGVLVDRWGTRAGILLGLAIISVSLLGLSRSTGFTSVAGSMLVLGVGGGTLSTGTNTAASVYAPARRAAMLNLFNLFFGVGGFLTPLVAAYCFPGNTRGLSYLVCALTVGVFLIHLRMKPPNVARPQGFQISHVARLAGNRNLLLICLFLFLYVACEVGVWNWFAKYLVTRGVPDTVALRTLSFGFALGILGGRFIASQVRVPILNVLLVSPIVMAIATWLMLQTAQPLAAGLLVFCAGLAMAPVFPTTVALVGDRFPVMTATAIGIAITSGWIGLAVSSTMIGALAGEDSSRLQTALLVIPWFCVAMMGVSLLLRFSLRAPDAPAAQAPA